MAVPSNPANLANGDTYPESFADDVRDLLVFFRDDRPMLKLRANDSEGGATQTVATSTDAEAAFSDGAGNFLASETVNVGGFTAGDSGDVGVYVPETGVYRFTAWASFDASTTGYRRLGLLDEGNLIAGSQTRVAATGSATIDTDIHAESIHYFTAGDEAGVQVYQNSGGNLSVTIYMTLEWLGSSNS